MLHPRAFTRLLTLALALALVPTIAHASFPTATPITSPTICLSDTECPSAAFCKLRPDVSKTHTCVPRHPLHSVCDLTADNRCASNLHCARAPTFPKPVCVPQATRGQPCKPNAIAPCRSPLVCHPTSRKCVPHTLPALRDARCSISTDCHHMGSGLYCHTRSRRCVPQLADGMPCDPFRDDYECKGFCAAAWSKEGGVCVAHVGIGAACTAHEQCAQERRGGSAHADASSPVVCNRPSGRVGVCMPEARLQTRQGLSCNPHADACDARRSLRCVKHKRGGGTAVCVQGDSGDLAHEYPHDPFCTRNDNRSFCLPLDVSRVCRSSSAGSNFLRCRRVVQRLQKGAACGRAEHALCAGQLFCLRVPGVQLRIDQKFPQEYRTCMALVGEGESCKNKFETRCAEGLSCSYGKCIKGEIKGKREGRDEFTTHVAIDAFCKVSGGLACVPGTKCLLDDFATKKAPLRRCRFPLRIVGEGKNCVPSALERIKCRPGLVCTRDAQGNGLKRCHQRHAAGALCTQSNECAEGLKCSMHLLDTPRFGRCYSPAMSLPLGAKCNPAAQDGDGRKYCVKAWVSVDYGLSIRETRCLPKGNGKGKGFACQVAVPLFERCADDNFACVDDGAVCGKNGVCELAA